MLPLGLFRKKSRCCICRAASMMPNRGGLIEAEPNVANIVNMACERAGPHLPSGRRDALRRSAKAPSPGPTPHPTGRGRTIYASGRCSRFFGAYPADLPVRAWPETWGRLPACRLARYVCRVMGTQNAAQLGRQDGCSTFADTLQDVDSEYPVHLPCPLGLEKGSTIP
jgi:hypothetical protein